MKLLQRLLASRWMIFEKLTINAMKSAFLPYDRRIDLIYSIIKPGYARVRESTGPKASR